MHPELPEPIRDCGVSVRSTFQQVQKQCNAITNTRVQTLYNPSAAVVCVTSNGSLFCESWFTLLGIRRLLVEPVHLRPVGRH